METYTELFSKSSYEEMARTPEGIEYQKGNVLIRIWAKRNTYEVFINGELAIQNAGTPISEQKISELIEQMEMFN